MTRRETDHDPSIDDAIADAETDADFDEAADAGVDAEFDVLEYTTPERTRDPRTGSVLRVDLAGEVLVAQQPKQATVYFMNAALSTHANTADEWQAVTEFVNSILDATQRNRFWARVCDRTDPLTAEALWEMVGALIERWTAAERGERVSAKVITVDAKPSAIGDALKPVRMDINGTGHPLTFHPPKDIALGFATSALGTGARLADQAWHLSLFLDATLSEVDGKRLSRRLTDHRDDFDLEDVGEIVVRLTRHWFGEGGITPPNRQARRAAASKRRTRKP